MRGVGFEPTTSQSDLRKLKENKYWGVWELNPRPLGWFRELKRKKIKWGCGDSFPHTYDQLKKVKEKESKIKGDVRVRSHNPSAKKEKI